MPTCPFTCFLVGWLSFCTDPDQGRCLQRQRWPRIDFGSVAIGRKAWRLRLYVEPHGRFSHGGDTVLSRCRRAGGAMAGGGAYAVPIDRNHLGPPSFQVRYQLRAKCGFESKRYQPYSATDFLTCGYIAFSWLGGPVRAPRVRTVRACGPRCRGWRSVTRCRWAAARRSRSGCCR